MSALNNEIVIVGGCVDPREHEFLIKVRQQVRQSGRECYVLRNPGCNFRGFKHSINNAHLLGTVAGIYSCTHGDCAAMRYVGEALDGMRKVAPEIAKLLVDQFHRGEVGMDGLDNANRKMQLKMAEMYVGDSAKDGYVGAELLPSKSDRHSIVAIIEPYAGTYEDIAKELDLDARGMYTLQLLSRENTPSLDLADNMKVVGDLVHGCDVKLLKLSDNDALYNAAEKVIRAAVPRVGVEQVRFRNHSKQRV